MELIKKYVSLDDVLLHLREQVADSVDYAAMTLPRISSQADLFYYLKDRTIYVPDPPDVELIMTMRTMMDGTRTGVPGGGDCDDFTITALACLIACGWNDNQVVLSGNSQAAPVHIYARTRWANKWHVFDLTEEHFDQERHYKWVQFLPFKL